MKTANPIRRRKTLTLLAGILLLLGSILCPQAWTGWMSAKGALGWVFMIAVAFNNAIGVHCSGHLLCPCRSRPWYARPSSGTFLLIMLPLGGVLLAFVGSVTFAKMGVPGVQLIPAGILFTGIELLWILALDWPRNGIPDSIQSDGSLTKSHANKTTDPPGGPA